MNSLRSRVIDMYLEGYSTKYIIDYVYKHLNRNASTRLYLSTLRVGPQRYSKDYCEECVVKTIIDYKNDRKFIV